MHFSSISAAILIGIIEGKSFSKSLLSIIAKKSLESTMKKLVPTLLFMAYFAPIILFYSNSIGFISISPIILKILLTLFIFNAIAIIISVLVNSRSIKTIDQKGEVVDFRILTGQEFLKDDSNRFNSEVTIRFKYADSPYTISHQTFRLKPFKIGDIVSIKVNIDEPLKSKLAVDDNSSSIGFLIAFLISVIAFSYQMMRIL